MKTILAALAGAVIGAALFRRLHPDDIQALARAIGSEVERNRSRPY